MGGPDELAWFVVLVGVRGQLGKGLTEDAEHFGQRRQYGPVQAFVSGWLVEKFHVGREVVAPGA